MPWMPEVRLTVRFDNLWSELSSLTEIVANLCLEFAIPCGIEQMKFVIQAIAFRIALLNLPVLLNGRLGPPRNCRCWVSRL
jgi:hypothetical protein